MIVTTKSQNLESLSEDSDNGTDNGNGNGKLKDISDIYFSDMGNYPVLTRTQEIELFKRLEKENIIYKQLTSMIKNSKASKKIKNIEREIKDTTQEIIMHNLPLVISITKHYRGFGVPFADLIQEGNFALLRAVNHYDLKKNTTFSTYATSCIIKAISRALKKSNKANRIASLDDSVGEQGNLDYLDLIPDSKAYEPGKDPETIKYENEILVRILLDQLDEPDRGIIISRYFKKKKLHEVGEELRLSKERARQIQNRALKRLREPVEAAGFG